MKIGIVGTGMIVHEILPVLYKMPEIELHLICGTKRSEEILRQLAQEYNINAAFTDFDDMLSSGESKELDALYIAVPNDLHYELAKKALESGKNVILEKPFVLEYKKALELKELAEKKGVMLLEAISNQYLDAYKKIKEALSMLGEITYAEANFSQYSSRYDRFMAGEYFKVFDKAAGGGALTDINIYNIHIMAGLFGMPKAVNYCPRNIKDVDVSGLLLLKYDNFIASCIGAKDSQGSSGILIQGTKGYMETKAATNVLNAAINIVLRDGSKKELIPEATDDHRMMAEFKEFARIVENKDLKEAQSRLNESLIAVKILEEAVQRESKFAR